MADQKISELTNITQANLASGDELVVVDADANETKAITVAEIDSRFAAASHTHTESDITDLQSYILDVSGDPLSNLSDVTITAIGSGELLTWSGSAWVNNTRAEAGVAEAEHAHPTTDIISGTMADARIAESNVTQHVAAIDHGSIGGLTDDDHTGYARLAGRSGGQDMVGGTASGNDLTLESTSNATKGKIQSKDKHQFDAEAHFGTEVDNGNSGTADTVDWGAGNKQKSTLTGNVTYTFTAPAGSCNLILRLIQDATGSRTVTWPATVKWPGGTAPTLTTDAAAVDIVSFYFDGTDYYGQAGLDFS